MSHVQKPRRRFLARLGSVVLIVLIVIVAWRFLLGFSSMSNHGGDWPAQFQSNGERIYFTATSVSGSSISSRGGGMHMGMMKGACADCHGADRQGGRLMPRFWKLAPALTAVALFKEKEHGKSVADDDHGDHEGYTDKTLRRAITRGLDPSNKPLDGAMPRWLMSPKDLDDLIGFLKSPARGDNSG